MFSLLVKALWIWINKAIRNVVQANYCDESSRTQEPNNKGRNSQWSDLASWYPCIVLSRPEHPCCFRRTPFRRDKNDLTSMTTPHNVTTGPLFWQKKWKSSCAKTALCGKARVKVVYELVPTRFLYLGLSYPTTSDHTCHCPSLNPCSLFVDDKN